MNPTHPIAAPDGPHLEATAMLAPAVAAAQAWENEGGLTAHVNPAVNAAALRALALADVAKAGSPS